MSIPNKYQLVGCSLLLSFLSSANAATVAYLRFDDVGATDGGAITTPVSEVNSPTLDASPFGTPEYSSDVPFPTILVPGVGGNPDQTLANNFSSHYDNANDRVEMPNNALFNVGDFTVELFAKMDGAQPGGFQQFVRRSEGGTDRWFIQHNHNNSQSAYGVIGTRFDMNGTTAINTTGADRLFVDTDSGDGDFNSYDSTPRDDGDGLNDASARVWHHLAFTYTSATNEIEAFFDYNSVQTKTLVDAFAHPNAVVAMGLLSAGAGDILIDEFRYTEGILTPAQFLQEGGVIPEPSSYAMIFGVFVFLGCVFRRRISK